MALKEIIDYRPRVSTPLFFYLKTYAHVTQVLDGDVFHYRDKKNLERALVIALHDGSWAAAEVKLGIKEEEDRASRAFSSYLHETFFCSKKNIRIFD